MIVWMRRRTDYVYFKSLDFLLKGGPYLDNFLV